MSTPIRLYMSMSLDGFIAGPDDRTGQELGHGGGRLFNWLDHRISPGVDGQVYGELMSTGAVISGRRTFELAGRRAARRSTPMSSSAPRRPAPRPTAEQSWCTARAPHRR